MCGFNNGGGGRWGCAKQVFNFWAPHSLVNPFNGSVTNSVNNSSYAIRSTEISAKLASFGFFFLYLGTEVVHFFVVNTNSFETRGWRHSSVDSSAPTIQLPWVRVPSTPSYAFIIYSQICALGICHVKRTKIN